MQVEPVDPSGKGVASTCAHKMRRRRQVFIALLADAALESTQPGARAADRQAVAAR